MRVQDSRSPGRCAELRSPDSQHHDEASTSCTLGLRHMEWTALLPVHRYSFMPSEASADGWAYVDFLSRWRDKKVPFRLIVLDSKGAARLNMPVTVDSFDVTVRKNGDLGIPSP